MKIETEAVVHSFDQFGLSEALLKAIGGVWYATPSPIQVRTIPLLLEGRDVVGQASEGVLGTPAPSTQTDSFSLAVPIF